MSYPTVLYGPPSEVFNLYTAAVPAPGNNGSGGPTAFRFRNPLGTQLILQDGRKYRFSAAGAAGLVVGNMLTAAVGLSTDVGMTPAAGAIGDRIITFTHGAATVVINYFAEGYAAVSVAPGGGDFYAIASHAALQNAVAGDIVNLAEGNSLRTALTSTSRVDLYPNLHFGVIQAPATTLTAPPVGVVVAAVAAAGAGWIQTRGPASVLTAGTLVIANRAVAQTGTAGAVGPETAVAATSKTEVTIGTVLRVAAAGAWSGIYLQIDG